MRDDNKPGDFARIAGKEESNIERRVPQAPLLEGISILLNWRKLTAFRCTVEVTFSDGSSEHDLIARPRNQSYRVTDMASGFVEAYDALTGMM